MFSGSELLLSQVLMFVLASCKTVLSSSSLPLSQRVGLLVVWVSIFFGFCFLLKQILVFLFLRKWKWGYPRVDFFLRFNSVN